MFEVITQKQTQKLRAVSDSYGSMSSHDSLYEDRTHSNGLQYYINVPDKLKHGGKCRLVTFLLGCSDLSIDAHRIPSKGVWPLPVAQSNLQDFLFVPRYRTFDDLWLLDKYRAMLIETLDDLVKEFHYQVSLKGIRL